MALKINNKQYFFTGSVVILFLFIAIALFVHSKTYPINASQLENIDGIPFPSNKNIVITEKLAHADIYLRHPSFGRALTITTTFQPLETESLFIGIRENSFWLSYSKIKICCSQDQIANKTATITKTVTIPITDKITDTNNSLDLMYFATNADSLSKEDESIYDKTVWILEDIKIISSPATPTLRELKNYVTSKLTREAPL